MNQSPLKGIKELLVGPTGTGKTSSIATMVEAGVETFVLFAEGGLGTLLGYWLRQGKAIPETLHWYELPITPVSFEELADQAREVNTLPYDLLCKKVDPKRKQHNQFEELYRVLHNFVDQKDGRAYGPVDSWGTGRCLAIDSLSGISPLALSLVAGNKTTLDKPHYGQAQRQIETLLRKLVYGCRCHFVLTAHPAREADEVLGGLKLYPSTVGKALAPVISPMFDDVLFSTREGDKFQWTSNNPQIDLKARHFPITGNFPQTFLHAVQTWKTYGGMIESQ